MFLIVYTLVLLVLVVEDDQLQVLGNSLHHYFQCNQPISSVFAI